MFRKELTVPVFNRFFYDLLEDVKKNDTSKELTQRIDNRYKMRNLKSQKNVQYFQYQFLADKDVFKRVLEDQENVVANLEAPRVKEKNVFKDVKLEGVLQILDKTSLHVKGTILAEFYILMLLAQIDAFYQNTDDADMEDMDALFNNVIHILQLIDDGKNIQKDVDDVYHENIKSTIRIIHRVKTTMCSLPAPPPPSSEENSDTPMDPFMEKIGDELKQSKLGTLANEIMQEAGIDEKTFQNVNDISDVFKSADMGKIIQTTTRTFQEKMQRGEISHQDLISECMGFIGKMGNAASTVNPNMPGVNPQDMANVMRLFGNKFDPIYNPAASSSTPPPPSSTKARLQKKVQERRSG